MHHGDLPDRGGVDHLWIRVADVAASRRFYGAIAPWSGFEVEDVTPEKVRFVGPAGAPTEHLHMAFPATVNAAVEAFHRAALEAGYRDHGAPGERPEYHDGYYGAFVLDPDGNNVEVVNHNR